MGYEWLRQAGEPPGERLELGRAVAAPRAALLRFFEHLESELDAGGFLRPPEKRPVMVRNIRNMFHRARLTEREVRTLRGIVTALAGGRRN